MNKKKRQMKCPRKCPGCPPGCPHSRLHTEKNDCEIMCFLENAVCRPVLIKKQKEKLKEI